MGNELKINIPGKKKDLSPADGMLGEEKKGPGRPKKAVKKKQYTLTMHPDLYKKIQKESEQTHKSIAQIITDAVTEYLNK